MASSEEHRDEPAKEMVHKAKLIQFLGRTTPIILQNDNGPCPLLAICNVLLLRNNLNLSPDITEVSQEKLLSLVAERLIDSNSNIDNKDAGYVENQQQNIADALDLLPRLATGIDVNIRFRRIDDFEFTRECAIFDLLDIPLCHGWIVDPLDSNLVNAIGLKSYNTLMEELVALETNVEGGQANNSEEYFIDFSAATTATLGVPSPCLPRGRSVRDSACAVSDLYNVRKGDMEEETELLRVLKLSEAAWPIDGQNKSNSSFSHDCSALSNSVHEVITGEAVLKQAVSSNTEEVNYIDQSASEEIGKCAIPKEVVDESGVDVLANENTLPNSSGQEPASVCEIHMHESREDEVVQKQSTSTSSMHRTEDNIWGCDTAENFSLSSPGADSDSSSGRRQQTDVPDAFTSSAEGSEPIYEGEECVLEMGTTIFADQEPMYEGELVLAEQVDKSTRDACDASSKDVISPGQGELIRNFLKINASQLSITGLFCLQDDLIERELCVFFRNNHFNTMFKFDGELYILATDQGYLNQPDLVWEKLNEVNGNTLFMTGDFKEFKIDDRASSAWDEQSAGANTSDYLANMDNSAHEDSNFSSDLQLAIALQQQEYEQQPQQPQQPHQLQHTVRQPPVSGSSGLVTGPQVSSRNSGKHPVLSSEQEPKSSKEKCIVM